MLSRRLGVGVTTALLAIGGAGCSSSDDGVVGAGAASTTVTTGESASLAPFCGPLPQFRALDDGALTMRAGETIDLGIVVDALDAPTAVERLRVAVVPPESAGDAVDGLLDADDAPGPLLVAEHRELPGEIRLPFDGGGLAPGTYRVVVAVDFVVDDGGQCPDNALPDGPYAGWVRESEAGELATLEIRG